MYCRGSVGHIYVTVTKVERTFIMIKPDGVQRGLVGEIIAVFERAGLSPVALKLLSADRSLASSHYPDTVEWRTALGNRILVGYSLSGEDAQQELGATEPLAVGKLAREWLIDFIMSGPIVVMVLEGNMAVRNGRRLCGATLPFMADPASIRGRFGIDSPDIANAEKRPVRNIVHSPDDLTQAAIAIKLWFPELSSRS